MIVIKKLPTRAMSADFFLNPGFCACSTRNDSEMWRFLCEGQIEELADSLKKTLG